MDAKTFREYAINILEEEPHIKNIVITTNVKRNADDTFVVNTYYYHESSWRRNETTSCCATANLIPLETAVDILKTTRYYENDILTRTERERFIIPYENIVMINYNY